MMMLACRDRLSSRGGRRARALAFAALGAGLALVLPPAGAGIAVAADAVERTIVIKDHRFQPSVVEVPAGVKVKLVIDNQDASAEEFESKELRREKVIPGKSKGTLYVGPLPKGEYSFFGEFHEKTAQGKLIAK